MRFLKFVLFSFLFFILSSNNIFSQSVSTGAVENASKTAIIKVKGITCSSDVKMISGNVEKLKGVTGCKAGKLGPNTSFEVNYIPSLISEKEIFAAIEGTGGCENPNDRPYKVKD